MLTLLLDGDVFCYKAALASEHAIQWTEDIITLDANLSEAKARFDDSIEEIQKKLEADAVVIALSDIGSGYWRRRVLPSYKMNRKAVRKPLSLLPLRQYAIEKYDAKLKPMLEGDDVLGILATHPTLVPGEKIIVSIDKDMKTIPGKFCRNLDGCFDVATISEEEADYWHMYQTLTGDATDGYTGCPGIGPKTAEKALASCKTLGEMWINVTFHFRKAGLLNEAAALTQARVARILRASDYDFKTKLPILWTPPTKGNDGNQASSTPTTAPAPASKLPAASAKGNG